MKQYTNREFIKICMHNGYRFKRSSGDHSIYINDKGRHISIPRNLKCVIARRLIKENNLDTGRRCNGKYAFLVFRLIFSEL